MQFVWLNYTATCCTSRPSLHILLVVKKKTNNNNKMADSFAKVNEQEIRELMTTQHQEYRVCLYNKTIIPSALVVVYELIANLVPRAFIYDESEWYNC